MDKSLDEVGIICGDSHYATFCPASESDGVDSLVLDHCHPS